MGDRVILKSNGTRMKVMYFTANGYVWCEWGDDFKAMFCPEQIALEDDSVKFRVDDMVILKSNGRLMKVVWDRGDGILWCEWVHDGGTEMSLFREEMLILVETSISNGGERWDSK